MDTARNRLREPRIRDRLRLVYETLSTARRSLSILHRKRYHLSNIRKTPKGVQSTDPRDQVYGVWSLLSDEFQRLGIRVDYTVAVEELAVDIASRCVRAGFLFTIMSMSIGMSALPDNVATQSLLNLPSWVSDLILDSTAIMGPMVPDCIPRPTAQIVLTKEGKG